VNFNVRAVNYEQKIADFRSRIDAELEHALPSSELEPQRLHAAMRYSVLSEGKRIRPLLAYAVGEVLGISLERIDPIAVAVELVHAYSLVHDDLPAMDDDELRRGRPTTHIAYDEATAILVGDALQVLAFQVLVKSEAYRDTPGIVRRLIEVLGDASGSTGMVGGQISDLAAEGNWISAADLEYMYALKTGRLIRAAILMACSVETGISAADTEALDGYSQNIGLAFQVKDDLLEIDGDTQEIGKSRGSDEKNHKATYPSLFGLDAARARAEALYEDSLAHLDSFGERAELLRYLSDYVVRRNN
jgi:geranylgeranyl pyrophosphate synthase